MVDIAVSDGVVISINDKLSALQPRLSSGCCIYRVPEDLRKVNEDAYSPLVVSIGPFHRNDEKLKPMQEQKLRYMQSLLKRNEDKNIGDYVQLVRERLQDIRNCYNQQIEFDDDAFVEMVLLDAAFIIEFFLHFIEIDFIGNSSIYLFSRVIRDMILEENQLPFFVLNDIYNLANPGPIDEGTSLIYLALVFAKLVNESEDHIQDIMTKNTEIKHFVDLLRLYCLPSTPETKPNHSEDDHNKTDNSYPSVTELQEAGLKFKLSKSKNLLDISYNNGVLEIPRLMLYDSTENVFRNLMMFEELHVCPNYYITQYIKFMDGLINTAKDVDILVQNGIICNGLGSNEKAATLINALCTNIVKRDDFYYSGVCKALKKYMSSKCNKWRAILKAKYFSHPWAAISVVYAIVLLILTILQVITGFIQINDSQPNPVNKDA